MNVCTDPTLLDVTGAMEVLLEPWPGGADSDYRESATTRLQ